MADVPQIIEILSAFVDKDHYVVDVRSAMKKLENPREDFEKVLTDPTVNEWHYYALEGLRSIAAVGAISFADGKIIMDGTSRVAQQYGIDEYYKSFDALALSPENATILVEFVQSLLVSRHQRDWLWLAVSAAGTIIEHSPDALTDEFTMRLQRAIEEYPEPDRQAQMAQVIEALEQRRRDTV